MAKDIQPNGDIVNDQDIGQENHHDDIEGQLDDAGIQTKTLIYLAGQVKPGEPLIDKLETTTAEEEGLQEITEIRLRTASGCGHVVHVAAEAGLTCLSCQRMSRPEPRILCSECSKNNPDVICHFCRAPVCYACRDQRWVDGEKRIVCRACLSTLRLRIVKTIIKWLLVAAAIYWLLRF
jgi:hypothetical protein